MNSRELDSQSLVTLHNRARNKRRHKTKPITASQRQTTAAGRRRIPNLDKQKPSRNKQVWKTQRRTVHNFGSVRRP